MHTCTRLTSISPKFAGHLYGVFPGGCVSYFFDFTEGQHIAVMEQFEAAIVLYPTQQLRLVLRHKLGMELTHDPARQGRRSAYCPRTGTTTAPASIRAHFLADVLADPRVRLGAGTAVVLATAMAARRNRVSRCEARAFGVVNSLPDSLYVPAWGIMQLGTLGAVPAAAGVAWLAGDHELAGRLLACGTGTWALSKVVKRMVRRPRPAILLASTRRRGPDAAGLGYLSGHAGVAVALGAAALPRIGPAGRAMALAAIPLVGLTRVYVGAHLPLDIAGGAALGLAVDAAIALTAGRGHCRECAPPRLP